MVMVVLAVQAPHAQRAQPSPSHRPESNCGRAAIAKTTLNGKTTFNVKTTFNSKTIFNGKTETGHLFTWTHATHPELQSLIPVNF